MRSCARWQSTAQEPPYGNGMRVAMKSKSVRWWRRFWVSSPACCPAKTTEFLRYMHPADAERLKVLMWSVREQAGR